MMHFEIRRYHDPRWDPEAQTWRLDQLTWTLAEFDAADPAEATKRATSLVFGECARHGRRDMLPTWIPSAADAIQAWRTTDGVLALVSCDRPAVASAVRDGCPTGCACPCHSDVEDPGPEHLPTCAWSDPDYGADWLNDAFGDD